MTKVLLVRHGQASAGTHNYDRLSTLGILQVERLSLFWQQHSLKVNAAFCGTLERQEHTAQLALAKLENAPALTTLPDLNEYHHHVVDELFGDGLKSDSGVDLTFDEYLKFMTRWRDAASPPANKSIDADSYQSWQQFSKAGFGCVSSEVAKADKKDTLAFFTSGGVVASILMNVLDLDFEATMHTIWETRNCSYTSLKFTNSGAHLIEYNAVPHLLAVGDESLITQI